MNYPLAHKAFAQMFEVPPDSAAAYLFTARVLLRQEFDPIAEEYAQKATALDPRLPLAHFFLGELHLYKSKIPEAIADFQAELALNPGHAATYYKLADAYSRVQRYDDAERLSSRYDGGEERDAMLSGINKLRRALAEAGFAPR